MKSFIAVSWKDRERKHFEWEYVIYFLILYALLVFRAPSDFFQPYLWAEDGTVLIQGSIYNGIQSVFQVGNGAYWVIPKLIALLCYWSVKPFNSIVILPYLMQVIAKVFTVLSVMYFISDKFEWLVAKKFHRFCICVGIILFMPQSASDTLTCETSLPFALFFAVYLIGLDLLCNSKIELPNWKQIIFMSLLALSSADALCIGAVAAVVIVRYFVYGSKHKIEKVQWWEGVFKLTLVLFAVSLQTQCLLSSGRVKQQLDVTKRIILNTKSFMFFPYWNQFHLWGAFLIGGLIWVLIWKKSKISCFTLIYSAGFSYLAMLYNCMAENVKDAYLGNMTSRYVFISFEIAAFMLGVAISKLIARVDRGSLILAYICLTCAMVTCLRTYDVDVIGEKYADCYKIASVAFDAGGTDDVIIPIGPWEPWTLKIPASISDNKMKEDLIIGIENVDQKEIDDIGFGTLTSTDNWKISGWIKSSKDNEILRNLFIKKGKIYIAVETLEVRDDFQGQNLRHNGYEFNIIREHELIKEGKNTLEFVGQTNDGTWHCGKLLVEINKEK